MKPMSRSILICLVVLGIAGGLIWGFRSSRTEQAEEADSEASLEHSSRTASEGGKTILTFDEQAQRTNGITVTTLAEERHEAETQANGVVMQLQPLLDLKASYNSALMDIAKARAAARASQAEYLRVAQLNQDDKNIADKTVEAARAASESDAAALQNTEQALGVLKNSMQLHWGATVAKWLEQGSPQIDALLAQRTYLLQVTPTSMESVSAPANAIVRMQNGTHVTAQLISVLPQLDARLQTPSYLYAVSAHAGVIPGINLPVFLPSGPMRDGIVMPYSAVAWFQGRAWCYVEESPGKFTREEVSSSDPAPGGWFVSDGAMARMRVVTEGAQTLLSEEFRSQIQSDQD